MLKKGKKSAATIPKITKCMSATRFDPLSITHTLEGDPQSLVFWAP